MSKSQQKKPSAELDAQIFLIVERSDGAYKENV